MDQYESIRTLHRVYEQLVQEHGFEGAESTVRRWIREYKASQGDGAVEAAVPLDAEAAREAEVDWRAAWVVMAGEQQRFTSFRSHYTFRARFCSLGGSMRVAIYARVSASDQSTESQLLDLRRYAADRGWTVCREYCDNGIRAARTAARV